nr:MAG TPA: hypothetical protein [Caudoviricetes sp.]
MTTGTVGDHWYSGLLRTLTTAYFFSRSTLWCTLWSTLWCTLWSTLNVSCPLLWIQ